nr:hypothetical protein [Tanacetum cinerariifolium]
MRGSEYGEQDRKAAILYEYETFKAIEGEQLLDTYLCFLQVINDLKKCSYKRDNCELNYKFLNNLQPEWKQYGTPMRQTKNLMDINIDALYNILKKNQGDLNDALGYKKKDVVVTSDPLALVLLDSDESSSSAEETIAKVAYYTSESKSESEYKTSEYYDNSNNYGLFVNNDDEYSALCDNDKQHRKKIEEQEILFDKMSRQLVEMNNNVLRIQEKILEKETKILEFEGCVSNKDVEIEKCLETLNECENKLHKIRQTNQIIHMIMPSKDTLYNGRKGIGFENPSYFEKEKDLRPSIYDEKVIGLGYTLMFLIHLDEALEIEKF